LVEELCYKAKVRGFDSQRINSIISNLSIPSSRIIVLGFTQPLIEMSVKVLPRGEVQTERKTVRLADVGTLTSRNPNGIPRPFTAIA
jgi:hypothetical protein